MEPRRILYVGDLTSHCTCRQRMVALQDLGHAVTPIDVMQGVTAADERSFISRVRWKLGLPADWSSVNDRVLEAMSRESFDILWLDKALTVRPGTLRRSKELQPKCRIVGYSPDDMYARHNQSIAFRRGLPLYDAYITTKSYGVAELESLGCPRVFFVDNGYDPHTHRPLEVTPEDRERLGAQVGFIGTWEAPRAASMRFLAENGIEVRIWGGRWEGRGAEHPNLRIEYLPLLGDDYARSICATDINLCFLAKRNRDSQTQRSVEIPACGGFMLAERTDEHLRLFEEGLHAAYFDGREELLDMTRTFLVEAGLRREIAQQGLKHARQSGYSYSGRLETALALLESE